MARQLQRADESKRGIRAWRRDWYPYEQYKAVHQSSMDSLSREGLVHRDTLTFREFVTPSGALRAVNLRGRIYCSDDVILTVNKWLEVALDDRNQLVVRGIQYGYHAWIRASHRRDLLRYDSAHAGLHRHFFDQTGEEVGIEPVPLDTLPRLDLVIRESVAVATGGSIEDLHAMPGPEA